MDTPQKRFDESQMDFIDRLANLDLASDEATTAIKNLELFSKCRPPVPAPQPEPAFVPKTKAEKVKAGIARIWDNETTRVLIKAGGAFAGVGVVVWSTVHRDHVLQREALAQANQRNV